MLFIGDDWAEAHHDVELLDEAGKVLVRRRLPEGVAGISRCTRWSPIISATTTSPRTCWSDRDRPGVSAFLCKGVTG